MDIDYLRGWIGREETASEVLTPMLAARHDASFDCAGSYEIGMPAPLMIHHCLCQTPVSTSRLAVDGHPERGSFLPPVSLPRRMWAGGKLVFHRDLLIGEEVFRRSVIEDVVLKQGRSGPLCFVTVRHEYGSHGDIALTERQDIVYRGMEEKAGTGQHIAPPRVKPDPVARDFTSKVVACDPVLLFRYSALTFNSHRIHYDLAYCRDVEGYPDLVIHGPLQTALLLRHAAALQGAVPETFTFRSIAPLFSGGGLVLNNCDPDETGMMRLWTSCAGGKADGAPDARPAMEARAQW